MKSKILLALTLLLGVSTTTWAVGNLGKANQKKHAYTNEDVWAAYEGFNNTLLDSNKYIYKTNSSYPSAVDRGNGAAATSHFSWRNNNMSVYKAFEHQHVPEIKQSLKQLQNSFDAEIDFIPYRGDFARGIFATMVVKTKVALEEIVRMYEEYYAKDSFVHIVDKNIDLKQVVNTNKCLIHLEKHGDKLLIISCIDNLLKGASGQAVHNMNLMFNLEETVGLRLKPSAF